MGGWHRLLPECRPCSTGVHRRLRGPSSAYQRRRACASQPRHALLLRRHGGDKIGRADTNFTFWKRVSATAPPSCRPQSRSQCRCSQTSRCPAAPREAASALALHVCRSGSRARWLPGLQNLLCCAGESWSSGVFIQGLAQERAALSIRSASQPNSRRAYATARLFGSMVRSIEALPVPGG